MSMPHHFQTCGKHFFYLRTYSSHEGIPASGKMYTVNLVFDVRDVTFINASVRPCNDERLYFQFIQKVIP